MSTSTNPRLNPEFQAFVTTTEIPSPVKHRSRLDRIASLTVHEILEFLDQRELGVSALLLTPMSELQVEACQLLFKALTSEGQTVYRVANELIDQRIKDEKRSSDQPDSTPSPGMA